MSKEKALKEIEESKKKALKEIEEYYNLDNWEEVPDEELWEDGEIPNNTCMIKIYKNVVVDGEWRLIRKKTKQ
tara:strand:- start:1160 stop:1378 length:219 start_codon:yes stop_codon:yes gene_type:complete